MAIFLIPLIRAKLPNKKYRSSSISNADSLALKATVPHRLIDFSTTKERLQSIRALHHVKVFFFFFFLLQRRKDNDHLSLASHCSLREVFMNSWVPSLRWRLATNSFDIRENREVIILLVKMSGFSLCTVNCITCHTFHTVCRQMSVFILLLVLYRISRIHIVTGNRKCKTISEKSFRLCFSKRVLIRKTDKRHFGEF